MQGWSKLKKTAVITAVALFGLGGIGALTSPNQTKTSTNPVTPAPVTTPKVQGQTTSTQSPAQTAPIQTPPATTDSSDTTAPAATPVDCPNGTYVNTSGDTVCSPYSAPSAPVGATAKCLDGTYSFSEHRSGTCSHHGGVAEWL